jgi:hypothetical protein
MAEHLTTGWEPDLADGDSLVRAGLLSTADRARNQVESVGGRVEADASLILTDSGVSGFFYGNGAFVVAPDGVERIDEVLSFYGAQGFVLMSPFPTGDLSGRGLQLMGHPPFMVRPRGGEPPPVPAGLVIEEVTDGAGLEEFAGALAAYYPMPAEARACFGPAMLGGATRVWIGREAGRPVGVAAAHISHGVVNIEWVAADPACRGKGYGAAMTWQATLADPTLPAVLISSDDGRPVYERMGYLPIVRWTLWFRP